MKLLALDIGKRRTGVAFLDTDIGVPVPLDTLSHTSDDALVTQVKELLDARAIEKVIVGLPLLPDGSEGEQVKYVRGVADRLRRDSLSLSFVDERYTTVRVRSPKALQHSPPPSAYDGDAAAACALLLSM